MQIKLDADVALTIQKLRRTDKALVKRIEKQLAIFQSDSKHPSLRTHKLTGNLEKRWSISINRSIRMVYTVIEVKGETYAYFLALGTHDQVYKK